MDTLPHFSSNIRNAFKQTQDPESRSSLNTSRDQSFSATAPKGQNNISLSNIPQGESRASVLAKKANQMVAESSKTQTPERRRELALSKLMEVPESQKNSRNNNGSISSVSPIISKMFPNELEKRVKMKRITNTEADFNTRETFDVENLKGYQGSAQKRDSKKKMRVEPVSAALDTIRPEGATPLSHGIYEEKRNTLKVENLSRVESNLIKHPESFLKKEEVSLQQMQNSNNPHSDKQDVAPNQEQKDHQLDMSLDVVNLDGSQPIPTDQPRVPTILTNRNGRESPDSNRNNENNGVTAIAVNATYTINNVDNNTDNNNNNNSEDTNQANETTGNNNNAANAVSPTATVTVQNNVQIPIAHGQGGNRVVAYDTWMILRFHLALFMACFTISIIMSRVAEKGLDPTYIVIVLYILVSYYILERLLRFRHPFIFDWQSRENFFRTLDMMSLILVIILIHLKYISVVKACNLVFLAPLAVLVSYLVFSKAPKSNKEGQAINRVLYTVQAFFLTAKLDGVISWNWLWVLSIALLFTVFLMVYCTLMLITFLFMTLFLIYKVRFYPNMSQKTQFIGVFWSCAAYSISLLFIIACIGANMNGSVDLKNYLVINSIQAGLYMSIFLAVYTLVFFRRIAMFHTCCGPVERVAGGNQESNTVVVASRKYVSVENARAYFVMISPTYFIEFKDSFAIRDKSRLQEMQQSVKAIRDEKYRRAFLKKVSKTSNQIQGDTRKNLESLKKDKEILDKRVMNVRGKPEKESTLLCTDPNSSTILPICIATNQQNNTTDQLTDENIDVNANREAVGVRRKNRMCLSEGNIAGFIGIDTEAAHEDENNGLCYICFTSSADAVMMECGHGGVCYDCAVEFLIKKGFCMECRGIIQNVAKINRDLRLKNIVISNEIGRIKEEALP